MLPRRAPMEGDEGRAGTRAAGGSGIMQWDLVRRLVVAVLVLAVGAGRAPATPTTAEGVGPTAALARLANGNARFVAGTPAHPDADAHTRDALVAGQHPFAVVLSCSDSRVPPEVVFDQGLGDLFVVRVAGNVLEPAVLASIEYAVEHLDARLIVVMGHESCGAVKAALATPAGHGAGSAALDGLLDTVRANVGEVHPAATDTTLREPVRRNVAAVAAQLVRQSPIVRERVERGTVRIVPALYALGSGQVTLWTGEDHGG
jgi:carbonic anhydrase